MVQNVVIQLVDDLDGGDAAETISFSLDSKSYEIDLNKKNAEKLRKALEPFVNNARSAGRAPAPASRQRGSGKRGDGTPKTLFSGLSAEEKDRFRAWSGMQSARRIGDKRVEEWFDAGRP